MTGEQIVKALKLCKTEGSCRECAYKHCDRCVESLIADALDRIEYLGEELYKWRECAKQLRENCKKCISKRKQTPQPRFQGRCAVCDLDLNECDWGDENWCLSDDRENNFCYCPRCGQKIDWKHDDFYDNYDPDAEFAELLAQLQLDQSRKENETI